MGAVRVMVVDDSPFSRMILAEALQEIGCEVVGEAESSESLVETYSTCKPDIVTMDIAMPGADGFECSNTLRSHDPEAKIILISSMKDEETEAEARRAGVSGYLQKPVEGEKLKQIIDLVISPDSLYEKLEAWNVDTFREALAQSVTRMTKTTTTFPAEESQEQQYTSQGLAVVIGIIGRYPGTMILDLAEESAAKMAEAILRRQVKNRDEIVEMAAEFANVVGGIACSMLNKREKDFGLRVAPPSVFYGAPTEVVSPNVPVRGVYIDTDFGRIYLSIGFKKGSVLWM